METLTTTKQKVDSEKVCCPEFDMARWDHKTHQWNNKLFMKSQIRELFDIPLPGTYDKAITKMWKMAEDAGAAPAPDEFLLLAYDPSPFKGELLMSITREVPGAEIVRLSGTFLSKVFDGPYSKVPTYLKEMNDYLASIDKTSKKTYFYFAYCPKCAKKYGHNYIVALAEV